MRYGPERTIVCEREGEKVLASGRKGVAGFKRQAGIEDDLFFLFLLGLTLLKPLSFILPFTYLPFPFLIPFLPPLHPIISFSLHTLSCPFFSLFSFSFLFSIPFYRCSFFPLLFFFSSLTDYQLNLFIHVNAYFIHLSLLSTYVSVYKIIYLYLYIFYLSVTTIHLYLSFNVNQLPLLI